jgi:transposase
VRLLKEKRVNNLDLWKGASFAMAPEKYLARWVSLPELQLALVDGRSNPGWLVFTFESVSRFRACPHCAQLSETTYDHRWVRCLDAPLRERKVRIRIRKKRYWCAACGKVFTEVLHGIFSRARLTERLRRTILWMSSRFQSLLAIARAVGCSDQTIRRCLYAHLRIHFKRHLNYGLPKKMGIDEHFFGMKKSPENPHKTEQSYHTTIVDLKAHRLYRAFPEKDQSSVFDRLKDEPGAENVREVTMDMSEGYRNVVHALFPNARITVDPFHVLRLLQRPLNRERHRVIGRKKRKNPWAALLLKSGHDLDVQTRWDLRRFLKDYPTLEAIYDAKERLHRLYRCRGRKWAEMSLNHLLKDLDVQGSSIPALKTLAYTLRNWRVEILNHFDSKLTNAMTEGFNNKIKLVKRMAYGFRNPEVYDLRILYACYH